MRIFMGIDACYGCQSAEESTKETFFDSKKIVVCRDFRNATSRKVWWIIGEKRTYPKQIKLTQPVCQYYKPINHIDIRLLGLLENN